MLRTAWRLHYNYGPKDPRYLDMTEEEILFDTLVLDVHSRMKSPEESSTAHLSDAQILKHLEKIEAIGQKNTPHPMTQVASAWMEGQ